MSPFRTKKIHISGARRSVLEQARGRLMLLSMFFIFAYVIVAARAADLSIIQGSFLKAEKDSVMDSGHVEKLNSVRGDIVDRNGVILARSLKTASLFADPKMIQEPEEVAKQLAEIFPEMSYGSLLQKLQSKKRFVWLKRNISPEQHAEILQQGLPGLNFKEDVQRIYPHGSLAVHMVGATGVDGQGLSGVEGSFDKYLAKGDKPLELTLDVRLQHAMKREIAEVIERHKAKAGAGIVMDIETGEILAAVSLPDYNPNEYKNTSDDKIFNRLSLGVYELGSSFKIFTTAALLEKNNNLGQSFDARQPLKVGRHKISDYHPENRVLSVPEVFIHSSNIGTAMMGQEIGTDYLKNFYKDLGLLDKPNFEISEVGTPMVPNPWREINTVTASYGHGIAVSPLQLVRAGASIVNGGVIVNPTIVRQSAAMKKSKKQADLRVVSPQTSHRMRQLLRLNVTEGTGKKADVAGFLVGGKTGTAEKPGVGGYNKKRLISSFFGFFPMNAPRYAVYVMVDEPQGTKESFGYATGGWVGAPQVGHVVSSMVSILGLSPDRKNNDFEGSLMRYVKTKEQIKQEQKIASH